MKELSAGAALFAKLFECKHSKLVIKVPSLFHHQTHEEEKGAFY